MTPTEVGLVVGFGSVVAGYVLGSIGKVSRTTCKIQHEALETRLEERWEEIKSHLKRLESKIDRLNGRGA